MSRRVCGDKILIILARNLASPALFVVTKLGVFKFKFVLRFWDIFSHRCSKQNRYFKPKHDVFFKP